MDRWMHRLWLLIAAAWIYLAVWGVMLLTSPPPPPDCPILPTPDGTATFAVAVETRAHELATGMRMATVAARHDEWSAHLTATWDEWGG